MASGYTIVFGGEDFNPDAFKTEGSALLDVGGRIIRATELPSVNRNRYSAIEFSDVSDGTYPLDPMTEALDLLNQHEREFSRLAQYPGVDVRALNIFGDESACTIQLTTTNVALLYRLSLELSVVPYQGD